MKRSKQRAASPWDGSDAEGYESMRHDRGNSCQWMREMLLE